MSAVVREALVEQRELVHMIEQLHGALDAPVRRLGLELADALKLLNDQPVGRACAPSATDDPPVAVFCLGAFELVVRGIPVRHWRPGKARPLFQYLVNHHGRPLSRSTLMEALWSEPTAAASTSLKVAVHALRQTLADISDAPVSLDTLTRESGYLLDIPGLWLDVEEFERCYTLGRWLEREGAAADASALYAHAATLYRGDFLEESWDDWAVFRRECIKDEYLFTLARLANAALVAGDYEGCILRCQRLVEKDRCRENAYRMLMVCHGRLGQPGRVRRWYDLCVQMLRSELDLTPEPETEIVYRRALCGKI